MKLDRNINQDGRGKYAILQLRKLATYEPAETFGKSAVLDAVALLDKEGLIDWGQTGTDREFFLIRLKDKYAQPALDAYATAAEKDGDAEYAGEIHEMANRSGQQSPWCKKPD